MTRAALASAVGLLLTAAMAGNTAAQAAVRVFPQQRAEVQAPDRGSFLKVAKWSTLLGSGAALGYGIIANRQADRDYEEIERICAATPERCTRLTNGQYADADLEARYRDVVDLDDRAKLSLTAGQVGLAASLVLFILDLPSDPGTEDIPYEPGKLRIGSRADGSFQVGYTLTRQP